MVKNIKKLNSVHTSSYKQPLKATGILSSIIKLVFFSLQYLSAFNKKES